jgi:hypothetical protein
MDSERDHNFFREQWEQDHCPTCNELEENCRCEDEAREVGRSPDERRFIAETEEIFNFNLNGKP